MCERIIDYPRRAASQEPLRQSEVSNWSIAIAIPLAIGELALASSLVSGRADLPFVVGLLVLFSPFVTFVLLAPIIHRRVLTFDRDAETLSIQSKILLIRQERVVVVPLSAITSAEFIDRSSDCDRAWAVRIGIYETKFYDVGYWHDKWSAYDYFLGVLPPNAIRMLRPPNARE